MRIIVHAGFHKTGTSSVQIGLLQNREALAEHAAIFLRDDILPMVKAARRFSIQRDPESLGGFSTRSARWLSGLGEQQCTILIATEDIVGAMPGRVGVQDYSALPPLMQALEAAAQQRFGDALEFVVYLSTRAPDRWIESLWWQHLRSTRFSMSLDEYRQETAQTAKLSRVVDDVRAHLKTGRVVCHALEDLTKSPEGVMTPINDLLNLPQALRLPVPETVNQRPDVGLEPVFLALNRSGLPDELVSRSKRQLLRSLRRQVE
ncbi:hypothetical protein [Pacificoceanicola onchidii]|uniref:hypothetical protein n=1 Tax=Pacificoceanicola onchidii TaxID=2562685 RepID=UPI0010A53FBC|nr:hypothetical protein [Pacificoceanicola onchidii]